MIQNTNLVNPMLFGKLPVSFIGRRYYVISSGVHLSKRNDRSLFSSNEYSLCNQGMNLISSQRHFSSDSLVAMQTKIFKYLSQSPATEMFKNYVVYIHDYTGLPWWATVIFSTFILRTFITLPLAIYQSQIIAKVENISLLEMPDIAKDVQKQTQLKADQLKWPPPKAKLYYRVMLKQRWNELIIKHNCHPLKATATLWFQLPTWIFFSSALRNMAYKLPVATADSQILFMKLAVGGFLWIPNLTQPDGSLVLPLLLGFSNLAVIEIQAMMRLRKPSRLQRYATNFFRCFSILLVPISATVPSIVCLYWTSSSLLGLMQNLFLMSNKVKKACRIPDTPTTLDHPYHQLGYEIKQKFLLPLNYLKKKT